MVFLWDSSVSVDARCELDDRILFPEEGIFLFFTISWTTLVLKKVYGM
jgi:hypothetical protein